MSLPAGLHRVRDTARAVQLYAPAWNVRASTSSCCSLVSFTKFTAYPLTLTVNCGYASGCSIASRSVFSSRTFTFAWYSPLAPPAASRPCFMDCSRSSYVITDMLLPPVSVSLLYRHVHVHPVMPYRFTRSITPIGEPVAPLMHRATLGHRSILEKEHKRDANAPPLAL